MVLKVSASRAISLTQLIEMAFYKRCPRLKRIKLEKFYSKEKAASVLNININYLKHYLITSDRAHGVELQDGTLIAHPESLINDIKSKMKTVIKKELNKRIKRKGI